MSTIDEKFQFLYARLSEDRSKTHALLEAVGKRANEEECRGRKLEDYQRKWEELIAEDKSIENIGIRPSYSGYDDPVWEKINEVRHYEALFETLKDSHIRLNARDAMQERIRNRTMTEQEYNFLLNATVREIVRDIRRGYRFGKVVEGEA